MSCRGPKVWAFFRSLVKRVKVGWGEAVFRRRFFKRTKIFGVKCP